MNRLKRIQFGTPQKSYVLCYKLASFHYENSQYAIYTMLKCHLLCPFVDSKEQITLVPPDQSMLLYWPIYCLDHPRSYLFILKKTNMHRIKVSHERLYTFVNKITASDQSVFCSECISQKTPNPPCFYIT